MTLWWRASPVAAGVGRNTLVAIQFADVAAQCV
jgi:hypothetical protein